MSDPILVYGATGYTARLVIEALLREGLRPLLSARDPGRLRQLAERWRLPFRAASVDDAGSLEAALVGMRAVLNLAGPFVDTAAPLLRACIEAGAHYLDVAGEVDSIRTVSEAHARAEQRGVMLMPAVGFDVVPSDCLCAHVASRLAGVRRLRIGISGLELASRGSIKTLTRELGRRTRVHRGGRLEEVGPGELAHQFDFGRGPRACGAVSWGDLVTAPLTTGAREVETYFELTPPVSAVLQANRQFGWAYRMPWVQSMLERQAALWSAEPSAEEMTTRRATVVVEGEDDLGQRVVSRLVTPEAYTLTQATATAITLRVAAGDVEPGFQTPGRLFGADFILRFSGVTRVESA